MRLRAEAVLLDSVRERLLRVRASSGHVGTTRRLTGLQAAQPDLQPLNACLDLRDAFLRPSLPRPDGIVPLAHELDYRAPDASSGLLDVAVRIL
jgi:hypothetical protein